MGRSRRRYTLPKAGRRYVPAPGPVRVDLSIRTLKRQVRMLFDNILIRRDLDPDQIGSIVVPDTAKELRHTGTVVAIGESVTAVKPGERVIFGKYQGFDITVNGQPFLCTTQGYLIAIVKGDVESGRID